MPRNQKRQFVGHASSDRLLTDITSAFGFLDAAVTEAEDAVATKLATLNSLLNPKSGKARFHKELTRDNNQRKYDHVAAVIRERAACQRLAASMEIMHPLLQKMKKRVETGRLAEGDGRKLAHLRLTFIESCRLYKEAQSALARFDEMSYEWTLDCFLDEEAKAAGQWLEQVPPLPSHGDCGPDATLLMLARCLAAIDNFGSEKARAGGFLGTVMYASDIEAPQGGIGIPLRTAEERMAAAAVLTTLRKKGFDAFIQQGDSHSQDLQINLPKKSGQ